MDQRCYKCGETKDIESFAWENKNEKIRKTTCRDCMRNYHVLWYTDYRKRVGKEELRQRQTKKIQKARLWKLEYLKSHSCVDCGESDPVVLDFDHVIKGKWNPYTRLNKLVSRGYPPARLEKEIAKCQVLCANCHRRKTAKEQGWYRSLN